jgi:hypothetical protein
MNISRRKFMKTGIMVAACAGIPLKAQFANPQEASGKRAKTAPAIKVLAKDETDILDYYTKSTFDAYVNTEFRVRLSEFKVRKIKLVEVRDYANASRQQAMQSTGEECFSLFFTAPSGRFFPQNTYEVEHAALGKFMLFIVPVGMRTDGEQYFEAAFNRCNQYSSEYLPPVTVAPSLGNTQRFPGIVSTPEPPTIITPTPPLKPR